ncbi:hypothetical protein FK531_14355 [Rhodococcus spelaei]|uniref:Uncharacterized protein n=1 Tax=Rhodococcus spelaei TaxID=2546320 RepID=A0A541B7I2_9NOCA|nr:hypothetical protein [Rhodococcus spelaei]TQF68286.1 hypothetical protein FK531_14355 [Rhodococcus spelaei]
MTTTAVVGTSPIAFTRNSDGGQMIVPLSALQFDGSTYIVNQAWSTVFTDPQDQTTLVEVAKARAAAGELTSAPPTSSSGAGSATQSGGVPGTNPTTAAGAPATGGAGGGQ